MKTKHTTLVGLGDDPGLNLGPDLGIGSVRGIKEDTGEELEVGRTIEGEIGIPGRKSQTGQIGVEATGRVVRAGTQEGVEALTVPWQKGWASNLHTTIKQTKFSKSRLMGKSSPMLPFTFNHPTCVHVGLLLTSRFPFLIPQASISFLLFMQA